MPNRRPAIAIVLGMLLSATWLGGLAEAGPLLPERGRAPWADFSYVPDWPRPGEPVEFTSRSIDPDGFILLCEWRFGHGEEQTRDHGCKTTRTFDEPGRYHVELAVTDNDLQTASMSRIIEVRPHEPVADFVFAPDPANVTAPVSFQDRSTHKAGADALVAWTWDFGDGSPTKNGPDVEHRYAAHGTYPVRLVVWDRWGQISEKVREVHVANLAPVVGDARVAPRAIIVGATAYFNATAYDPDGAPHLPLAYEWRFHGGTLEGENVTRTFDKAGEHVVTLLVRDGDGATSKPHTMQFVVEHEPPMADFTVEPAVPTAGSLAAFADASTPGGAELVEWRWDFGDGTSASDPNPVKAFAYSGRFAVTLAVTDANGRLSSMTQVVRVNAPPTAAFAVRSSTTLYVGTNVTFTDVSVDEDGELVARRWDFGDGTTIERTDGGNVTHAYATPGKKTVRLEVVDSDGATDVMTREILVENRRPVARFATPPGPLLAGAAIGFKSLAYDPDGTPLVSWRWDFGDGSTSNASDPVHSYVRSGQYLVSLRVNDGHVDSLQDNGSYVVLPIMADHATSASVDVRLPDGRPAPLDDPNLRITAHLLRGLDRIPIEPTAQGSQLVLALGPGEWMRGDVVAFHVQDTRHMDEPAVTGIRLHENAQSLPGRLVLPLPLVAHLDVEPGEREGAGLGSDRDAEGAPVYRDSTEAFHGTGRVTFLDGEAAAGALLTLWVRPVTAGAGAAEWCEASHAVTDAAGHYAWSIKPLAACQLSGAWLPGEYEVRASAAYPGATSSTSTAARVRVDPAGGASPA